MAVDPRAFIAVIIILFMIFSPDPQPPAVPVKSRSENVLAFERHALGVTTTSRYGDFAPDDGRWLNLTGFTNDTGFAWSYLHEFRERADQLTRHALGIDYENKFLGQPAGQKLPFFRNVSGVVHGSWMRNDGDLVVHPPGFNISIYAPEGPFGGTVALEKFGRNLTSREGRIRVRFEEFDRVFLNETRLTMDGQTLDVGRFITAQIRVESLDGSTESWEAQANGVHFLESGHMVLSTTSDKFGGIYALPHIVSQTPYYFNVAQRLVSRAVNETIRRQLDGRQRLGSPFTSHADSTSETPFTTPHCELIVYLQQEPLTAPEAVEDDHEFQSLRLLEHELRFPTGARVPRPRQMRFSLLAFSPDCGYALETKGPPNFASQVANHMSGIKIEVEHQHARHHVILYMSLLGAQLWLLKKQMKDANTPSMRSRISFYTVSMLSLGDGFTTMSFALISLFVPGLWVLLIATCFLAFLSVSFFGMRFLMDIWTVQAPERQRYERERRAGASASIATIVRPRDGPESTSTAAVQSTAGSVNLDTGVMPVTLASDQDELVDDTPMSSAGLPAPATANRLVQTLPGRTYSFGAMYTRFYFLLLVTLFLSLNATSWPPAYRRFYFTFLAFLYLSFWLPQIGRNAIRNCRRSLRWDFVVGQSILRLAPFAYFYGYGSNVVFADVDVVDLAILAGWLWIQCLILASQEILGPRWFVKSEWVPPAYDYHPQLHEDEEGSNLPVGSSESPGDRESGPDMSHDKNSRVFDCAICMQDIQVRIRGHDSEAEGSIAGPGGLLARRGYMLTPCRHIFHAKCLEGWMKFRLQCPICREDLPPM